MKKTNTDNPIKKMVELLKAKPSNRMHGFAFSLPLFTAIALLFIAGVSGCDSGGDSDTYVSTLTRPVALDIAVVDYSPSDDEIVTGEAYSGYWESCYAKTKRPFAFIANSSTDSVARIDLCTGSIENAGVKSNPYVISHIPVGRFPVDVAVSLDEGNTRAFIANGGENSLSVIQTREARTLQEKVQLSSRPTSLAVAPSAANPEGDVFVSLPYIHSVARVTKNVGDDEVERWLEKEVIVLTRAQFPSPTPGGLAVDEKRNKLYIADMENASFHILDLNDLSAALETRDVQGAQRNLSLSPDGRFLYLTKLDEKGIAVFDIEQDRYIDTNEELPTHRNSPAPGRGYDYDIPTSAIPNSVVFVDVAKEYALYDDDLSDGDVDFDEAEIENGETTDTDEESGTIEEEETEVDGDEDLETVDTEEATEEAESAEAGVTEEEEETTDTPPSNGGDDSAGYDGLPDLWDEAIDDIEYNRDITRKTDKALFAYSVGRNGHVQVIDVHDRMHELFDTNPTISAAFDISGESELEKDVNRCVADIEAHVYTDRTPDALWELIYQGLIPDSDRTTSGRFDFNNNRFYDDAVDFTSLEELFPRPTGEAAENGWKGDELLISTSPIASGGEHRGCMEQVEIDGETSLVAVDFVHLEILQVTPDYLVYDPRGIRLEDCFNTHVEYGIRANENYLVYMTRIDPEGNRVGDAVYQGRAKNAPFKAGEKMGEDEFQALIAQKEANWSDSVCVIERTENETGDTFSEYIIKTDLDVPDPNDEEKTLTVNGTRCISKWKDGQENAVSFENDLISFAICQDTNAEAIRSKQNGSFKYTFRTTSGVNEIRLEGQENDAFVGSNIEDAAYLDLYPDFPRLYLVDSSEEALFIIDLATDEVLQQIY